jgi:hypothetical protein
VIIDHQDVRRGSQWNVLHGVELLGGVADHPRDHPLFGKLVIPALPERFERGVFDRV